MPAHVHFPIFLIEPEC